MKLQLGKTIDDQEIVIILKDLPKYSQISVKPLAELDVKDEIAIDNGSIQMALWILSKDEVVIIKGATFDTDYLPMMQQKAVDKYIGSLAKSLMKS
jgi:hypothetical protein